MADSGQQQFDYNKIEIGEDLGTYEYVLSQETVDKFRTSVDDPEAPFPTLGVGHERTALGMKYEDTIGGLIAGSAIEFHNPPTPGKRIIVTGRVADKYWRRDKPYLVLETIAVDEDGRLLEKMLTNQMKKPDELGKKWQPQS